MIPIHNHHAISAETTALYEGFLHQGLKSNNKSLKLSL